MAVFAHTGELPILCQLPHVSIFRGCWRHRRIVRSIYIINKKNGLKNVTDEFDLGKRQINVPVALIKFDIFNDAREGRMRES